MQPQELRELSFDVDIGSSEGLSVDQMTRGRLQFLIGQNAYVVLQTQFADAKAGILLAIVGALAIIVSDRQTEVHPYLLSGYILVTFIVVAICLLALLPRVPKKTQAAMMQKSDLFSWPSLSSDAMKAEEYADLMRSSNASVLVMSIARSNVAVAQVLRVKYRLLRLALGFAMIDLIALGIVFNASMFSGGI
ncbi:MAG: Pycsar system effector family protein [Pseudomonadota bacterium]